MKNIFVEENNFWTVQTITYSPEIHHRITWRKKMLRIPDVKLSNRRHWPCQCRLLFRAFAEPHACRWPHRPIGTRNCPETRENQTSIDKKMPSSGGGASGTLSHPDFATLPFGFHWLLVSVAVLPPLELLGTFKQGRGRPIFYRAHGEAEALICTSQWKQLFNLLLLLFCDTSHTGREGDPPKWSFRSTKIDATDPRRHNRWLVKCGRH